MHNYISGQWTRSAATETVPVLNPATGEELGPHQEGELCVRGPQIMKGYLNSIRTLI